MGASLSWDETQPTNTTKLRDLGVVIRPNWVAIEDADSTFQPKALNLTNRTVSGPSNDPTAIANAYIMYCKDDTAGNAELFGINDASQVVQFTRGPVSAATNGYSFLPGGILIQWGEVVFGAISETITFPKAFTNIPFSFVITGETPTPAVNGSISFDSLTNVDVEVYRMEILNPLVGYYIAIGV